MNFALQQYKLALTGAQKVHKGLFGLCYAICAGQEPSTVSQIIKGRDKEGVRWYAVVLKGVDVTVFIAPMMPTKRLESLVYFRFGLRKTDLLSFAAGAIYDPCNNLFNPKLCELH